MREVPVGEEESAEETLDVEGSAVGLPLFGQDLLCGFSEEGGDFVLVESVEESAFGSHCQYSQYNITNSHVAA